MTQSSKSIIVPGENCWRYEPASRASVIVDAENYFRFARRAMLKAKHQILLIGWDFDTRITLDDEEPTEGPLHLGPFLSWLVAHRPDLHIYILKWDLGAIKLLGRGSTLFRLARWMTQDRISFRLDAQHPAGASHHQKILVIDDMFAFCGGIDMTGSRWDTREHLDDDPGRRRPTTRRQYGPWHDATMAVEGPIAHALGEHARLRWEEACGKPIPAPPKPAFGEDISKISAWPKGLPATIRDRKLALSRTRGGFPGCEEVREVEHLFADMIGSAQHRIYAESQYFASRIIAEAILKQLEKPDGPEIVIINPKAADGWLEESVMGPARAELFSRLKAADKNDRFRIYTPVTAGGEDIYVHAKIMIVDDRMMRVGSANFNNRSMGLDSECDLTFEADGEGDDLCATIAGLRADLLAEHLGTTIETVQAELERSGSLIATIEALRTSGRTLSPFTPPEFSEVELQIARDQLLDPESSGEPFERPARPGLLTRINARLHGRHRHGDVR
jgi:phospholipase D1/2